MISFVLIKSTVPVPCGNGWLPLRSTDGLCCLKCLLVFSLAVWIKTTDNSCKFILFFLTLYFLGKVLLGKWNLFWLNSTCCCRVEFWMWDEPEPLKSLSKATDTFEITIGKRYILRIVCYIAHSFSTMCYLSCKALKCVLGRITQINIHIISFNWFNIIILCSNTEICQFPVCYLGSHGFAWDQRWTASSSLGLHAGKGRTVFLLVLILVITPVISTFVCSSTILKHSYLEIWRYKRGYSLLTLPYYCVLRVKWIIPSANCFLCKCIHLCFVSKYRITINIWIKLVNVWKLFFLLVSVKQTILSDKTSNILLYSLLMYLILHI